MRELAPVAGAVVGCDSAEAGRRVGTNPRGGTPTSTGITDALARLWRSLNARTIASEDYWWISLQNAAFFLDMDPVIRNHARGRCLDLGAGRLAWKTLLGRHVESYLSGDVAQGQGQGQDRLDVVLDATEGLPFRSGAFDTVFCCSVLEHATEPWKAFPEIRRVLADGGVAIVSLPFVLHLHDEPHDYYRFTRYGFEFLARRSGFRIEEMVVNGGLFHLILNVPSAAMSSCWDAFGLRSWIRPGTRAWLGMARLLDRLFLGKRLFASNHIAALRKVDDTH